MKYLRWCNIQFYTAVLHYTEFCFTYTYRDLRAIEEEEEEGERRNLLERDQIETVQESGYGMDEKIFGRSEQRKWSIIFENVTFSGAPWIWHRRERRRSNRSKRKKVWARWGKRFRQRQSFDFPDGDAKTGGSSRFSSITACSTFVSHVSYLNYCRMLTCLYRSESLWI